MNAIQLTGRLTRDPELHTTDNATVCKLRLAVDRMGRSNSVGYVDVATFGKAAEACAKVLAKGWLVAVDGSLEYSEWEAADGSKRSGHAVVGLVEFLAAPKASASAANADAAGEGDEDIPF